MDNMHMKKTLNTNTSKAFNYSSYLRDYYFKLASGEEKVPSNAELELFIRKLIKTPVNNPTKITTLLDNELDEAEDLKLIA
jgi:hypothetical protein